MISTDEVMGLIVRLRAGDGNGCRDSSAAMLEAADALSEMVSVVDRARSNEREAWAVANVRLDAYTDATREMHARELHHFEEEQLRAHAFTVAQSAIATGDQCWGTPNFDWYDIRDILTKIEHVE